MSDLAAVLVIVAPAGFAYLQYQAGALVLFQNRMTRSLAVITPLVAAGNIALAVLLVPPIRPGRRGCSHAGGIHSVGWRGARSRGAVRVRALRAPQCGGRHRGSGRRGCRVAHLAARRTVEGGPVRRRRRLRRGFLLAGRREARAPSLRTVKADGQP